MISAPSPVLYAERLSRVTAPADIDRALNSLAAGAESLARASLAQRIRLAEQSLEGLVGVSEDLVDAACRAKGLPAGSLRGEELGAGPLAAVRYLRLLISSLRDIERYGAPQLPAPPFAAADGTLCCPVVPAKGVFDGVLFAGFRAHVRMQAGVTRDNLAAGMATYYRRAKKPAGIALVLGAGNVSSIAPTDAFSKIFHEGRAVLLKMNPVNEYLGPFFERAFAELIAADWLKIVYGGAETGARAIDHRLVDEVHLTGSIQAHHTIVWGPPGEERDERLRGNRPLLTKPVTSELGNVTPWIVVPANYSQRELDFQAENVAAAIVNNASFNCIAAKMIVTWRGWKQRQEFLDRLRALLGRVPPRTAYYPGAEERFHRFAGSAARTAGGRELPWTLLADLHAESQPLFFQEESFVCVTGETALDAASEEEFLVAAVDFVNEQLWGTLGVAVTASPKFRRAAGNERLFQECLARLRYGTVAINHWPALAYAMMSPPWGGYPGGTLADPQSGLGWVHNTYMLEQARQTVLEGPLVVRPKPFWFPTHRRTEALARRVIDLYHRPAAWKLVPLGMLAALG